MLPPDFHERRRFGIGGSELAAVANLSPRQTALDVYLAKTEGRQVKENAAMRWGNLLEPIVADEYARVTGNHVRHVNQVLAHPEHDFILFTPDGEIVGHPRGPGVLEIKTAGQRSDEWGEPGTDQVPLDYHLQVDQGMLVTGYTWGDLAVLFMRERELAIYHLELDKAISEFIIQIETEFWHNHVQARVPPPPTSAEDLLHLFPTDNGQRIVATPAIIQRCLELRQIKNEIKIAERKQSLLQLEIKEAMGEAAELVSSRGQRLATWKTQTKRSIDAKALREQHPEIAEAFTRETSTRVLRLKTGGKND